MNKQLKAKDLKLRKLDRFLTLFIINLLWIKYYDFQFFYFKDFKIYEIKKH
jgi:hypothetical protein